MGSIHLPRKTLFFCGILLHRDLIWDAVRSALEGEFGEVLAESPAYPFTSSDYYREETGPEIDRRFLAFDPLRDPTQLADWKVRSNDLESALAGRCGGEHPRPVNIDPGYVDLPKIVLASTKDFSHRIPLQRGIYAEVTLIYRTGTWQVLPWTFPDFAAGAYYPFFQSLRTILHRRRKAGE